MPRLLTRSGVVAAGLFVALAVLPAPVDARGDIDFTLPTDGATVGAPVSEITVAFTEPVTLVGNGFEVLDPQGNLLLPFAVTGDDMVFRLQLDPPIAGGQAGVRYEVTSADGHVVSGSFSFTVDAPPPTTTPPTTIPPTTASPATSPPTTEPPTTVPPTTSPPTTASAVTAFAPDPVDDGSNTGLVIVLAGVVAGAAVAFLVLRSRR